MFGGCSALLLNCNFTVIFLTLSIFFFLHVSFYVVTAEMSFKTTSATFIY